MAMVLIWILVIWATVTCLGWMWWYGKLFRTGRRLRRFGDVNPAEVGNWPTFTVVVAAKDEAGQIEAAVRTLLGQDYPNLEIVVVNDRSADETGVIIDRLAAEDKRLTPVHVTKLPEGWLGKVHALHRGVLGSRQHQEPNEHGGYYLFCDADVHFAEGTLRKAVAWCEQEGLDHLTLLPRVDAGTFWLDVVLSAFGVLFMGQIDVSKVEDADSDVAAGVGAFNMVRRSVFEKKEGFEWLRLEVADDLGVGLLMKRSGGKCMMMTAMSDVWLTWYENVGAMAKGLEKNIFPVACRFAWWRLVIQVSAIWLGILGPWVAVVLPMVTMAGPSGYWLWGLVGLSFLVKVVCGLALRQKVERSFMAGLALPIGFALISWMMVRSAVACSRQGGIRWRETFYGKEDLLAGQRVEI